MHTYVKLWFLLGLALGVYACQWGISMRVCWCNTSLDACGLPQQKISQLYIKQRQVVLDGSLIGTFYILSSFKRKFYIL